MYIGRYTPFTQTLWRASQEFHKDLDILLMQNSLKLMMDENLDFKRCLTPLPFLSIDWLIDTPALTPFQILVFGVCCIIVVI